MAAPVATTYPTQDNTDITINESPVEKVHWDDGVTEKQNFVYKYRRDVWVNHNFDRITGDWQTLSGIKTQLAAYDDNFYDVGGTATGSTILQSGDDFDAEIVLTIRVRYRNIGVSGVAGEVQVTVDDGTGPFNVPFNRAPAAADPFAWEEDTQAIDKLTTPCRFALNCKVGNVADEIEVANLLIYTTAQGNIE